MKELTNSSLGLEILASATPKQISDIAREIIRKDLSQFLSFMRLTCERLNFGGSTESIIQAHLEHLLWVRHREAFWRSGKVTNKKGTGLRLSVRGKSYLKSTDGNPLIIITPMSLAFEDALWVISKVIKERSIVVYGEGLENDRHLSSMNYFQPINNIDIVGHKKGMGTIIRTLLKGGVFLTYPDFVYSGHPCQSFPFLGQAWPFSSAFISLCSRPGIILLGSHLYHRNNKIRLHLYPPVKVMDKNRESEYDSRWSKYLMGSVLSQLLQQLVLKNPAQWQLLSSLYAENQQQARVGEL